jgi:hypothetical protein
VVAAATLAACSVVATPTPTPTPTEDEMLGGMPLPRQRDGVVYPGARLELDGVLELAPNGCFLLETDAAPDRLIVWPSGTTQPGGGGPTVTLPDGTTAVDGDELRGSGVVVPVAAVGAGEVREHWLVFCDPDAASVVVFDRVAVTRDQ